MFDFLGFGSSGRSARQTYTFAHQLLQLETVVDTLGLVKFVPIVHDTACFAGLNFASRHASWIESIVVLNSLYHQLSFARLLELTELFASERLPEFSASLLRNPAQLSCVLLFQEQSFLADRNGLRPYPTHLSPILGRLLDDVPTASRAFAQLASQVPKDLSRDLKQAQASCVGPPGQDRLGSSRSLRQPRRCQGFKTILMHSTSKLTTAGHWRQLEAPEEVATAVLASA